MYFAYQKVVGCHTDKIADLFAFSEIIVVVGYASEMYHFYTLCTIDNGCIVGWCVLVFLANRRTSHRTSL